MASPWTDRLPPQDTDAERYVIGAVLTDTDAIHPVMAVLKPEDFYVPAYGAYFRVVVDLVAKGLPVDFVSVGAELDRLGEFKETGGHRTMEQISDGTPHTCNVGYHATSVKSKATLRNLISACNQTAREAYVGGADPSVLLAATEARIFALANDATSAGPLPISVVLDEAWERIEARAAGEVPGVETGFGGLDRMLGGSLADGEVTVLAARPSMGKTAFALGVCEHAAAFGQATLLLSMEMGCGEIGERILASRGRVDAGTLRRPMDLSHSEWSRLDSTRREFSGKPLWVDDSPARSMAQISAVARREKAFRGTSLLVVDYLQLIDGTGEGDRQKSRQEVVSQLSRRFKVLAKELGIPVLLLSQLNRECEARTDKRPLMSDLRESGAIEQDADVVLLLHRPDYYDPNDRPGLAEVIVAKNRNGATGRVDLEFLKHQARFADVGAPTYRPQDAPFPQAAF